MSYITVPEVNNPEARKSEIKAILDAGMWVKFTYYSGIVKIVKEWNPDENGDLTADYSSGVTKFICPTVWGAYSFEGINPS